MTRAEIKQKLEKKFPGYTFTDDPDNNEGIIIKPEELIDICKYLVNDIDLAFNFLNFVTAIDRDKTIDVVYMLSSIPMKHRVLLKVSLSRQDPQVDSVSGIWPTANWHEREAYDLFGIKFNGHPDLRRIMMFDNWKGYPLRKDFVHENLIHKPDME
ncbi:MAG: NADH-quinone oxidoreductase subunit C [Candidatus Eremiobacteraeota bacterium]|nr:NADH-quinone oxidoreductase subunit C [Candidatus Eremiobacteraeota bacterium]